MKKLRVTCVKSKIGQKKNQRDSLRTLGLRKIGMSVELEDSKIVRGLIRTVAHLVKVEEV